MTDGALVLDQNTLKSIMHYDPETGVFTKRSTGKPAGFLRTKYSNGRLARVDYVIYFSSKKLSASRMAFLYMTGCIPAFVDHRNGDPSDDRWVNLRAATLSQNGGNRRVETGKSVPLKGVVRRRGRYAALINSGGKQRWLGVFDTAEGAHAAYMRAAVEVYGEFARAS